MRLLGRPEGALAGTFVLLILIGSILLALPVSHAGDRVGVLGALFTATSAVCVTGLVVVDTGRDFTPFGQVVILALIQLGGLGIMTFAAVGAQMLGKRLSFRSQAVLFDTFYQQDAAAALRHSLRRIIVMTFVIELIGVVVLYSGFRRQSAGHSPLFSAVFHSVSAFCNAGFSLYGDSLTLYRGHVVTMVAVMGLIILGGAGHTVVLEALSRGIRRLRGKRNRTITWSLNSRVVLRMSAVLIVVGASFFLVFGLGDDGGGPLERVMNAVFQSVTARTAGFNTVDIGHLPLASLLVLVGLMFVGGSPGSCAGGIKTTSLAVWYAHFRSKLRTAKDAVLFGRRLPEELVARAAVIGGLAVLWNGLGCIILAITESSGGGISFESLLFEQVSAFATVGLSTGVTPHLSSAGALWIVATMFVGRLGPLTAAFLVMPQQAARIRFPEERLMIG